MSKNRIAPDALANGNNLVSNLSDTPTPVNFAQATNEAGAASRTTTLPKSYSARERPASANEVLLWVHAIEVSDMPIEVRALAASAYEALWGVLITHNKAITGQYN